MRILFFTLLFFFPLGAYAQDATAFCAPGTPISYPSPDSPPIARAWTKSDIMAGIVAAECAKWLPDNFPLKIALTGSFRHKGNASDLLARFGKISSLRGVQYWSVTDNRWETLVTAAAALNGLNGAQRPDFTPNELKIGNDFYFTQKDNRSSRPVVYRMQIDTHTPKKLVIRISNASSLYFLMIPFLKPGDIKFTYVLEQLSPKTWGYFSLMGLRNNMEITTINQNSSWINRAVAMYGHFSGVQIDQEPPLIRQIKNE